MASQALQDSKKRKPEAVSPPPTKRKVQSITTNEESNVSAFFTPTSQKAPDPTRWRVAHETLLIAQYTAAHQSGEEKPSYSGLRKIAAFDLDSTLITTSSGKKFARDASDWKWWDLSIPRRLQDLRTEGFQLVIVTNQAGLSLGQDSKSAKTDAKRVGDFKSKIGAVLRQLDLSVSVYAATERDGFRKPRLGMWREFLHDHGLEGKVDLENSIFVGDAGGRLKSDGLGNDDFSTSDRDFAANAGILYRTPEEYFLGESARDFSRSFDPVHYLGKSSSKHTAPFAMLGEGKELVLLCGSPGSGKSTFYWNHLKPLGYERVNQDTLKTRERCLQRAQELLAAGHSVVVDNTNADVEARAHWMRLAGQMVGVKVRCIRLMASAKLSQHNNAVRALGSSLKLNPEGRTLLPNVAFTSFASRFREPRLDEGFTDITKVEFTFEGDDTQREIWSKFWT